MGPELRGFRCGVVGIGPELREFRCGLLEADLSYGGSGAGSLEWDLSYGLAERWMGRESRVKGPRRERALVVSTEDEIDRGCG